MKTDLPGAGARIGYGQRAGVDAVQRDVAAGGVRLAGAVLEEDGQSPPSPVSSVTPGAAVMTAGPGSRWASTTPLDQCRSLAINVRLPLSVVMPASRRMLRPASRVRAPPLPPGG